jgi:hypothetical protein
MSSAQPSLNQILGVNQRGVVECEKCHSPIYIRNPGTVSVEFCVPCGKCGHRGIYFKRMIHADDGTDRRRHPR